MSGPILQAATGSPVSPTESDVIGRYRILAKIGGGGMADVYLAEVRGVAGFARYLALKVIRAELAANADFQRWFTREGLIGAHLTHPNIVATLDFGADGDRLFMVMELVEGPSLEQVILHHRRLGQKIPPAICLEITLQLLRALDHAHCSTALNGTILQTVHCDLKPSNILVSRHGQAKITDFGIARAVGDHLPVQQSQVFRGTALYMSPEQAEGEFTLDARSDLFSLGLILTELLTLEPVYERGPLPSLLRQARKAEVGGKLAQLHPLPAGPQLVEILGKALDPVPAQRFSSAREFARALSDVVSHLPRTPDLETWMKEASGVPSPSWIDAVSPPGVSGSVKNEVTRSIGSGSSPTLDSVPLISLSLCHEPPQHLPPTLPWRAEPPPQDRTAILGTDHDSTAPFPRLAIHTAIADRREAPPLTKGRTLRLAALLLLPIATVMGMFLAFDSIESPSHDESVQTGPTSIGSANPIPQYSEPKSAKTPLPPAAPPTADKQNPRRLPASGTRVASEDGTLAVPIDAPIPSPRKSTSGSQSRRSSPPLPSGTLILNSRPFPARLFVDGTPVGDTSRGHKSRSMSAGTHEISFQELSGNRLLNRQIELQSMQKLSCVAYFLTDEVVCEDAE